MTGKEELLACLEIGKLLTSTLDHNKIFEHIMERGSRLIKAQHWSLLIKDEETGKLRFEIVMGADKRLFEPISLSENEGIAAYVAQTGTPMFVPDVTKEPRFNSTVDKKTGFSTRSIICIPLTTHGKVYGVIELINVENLDHFSAKEYSILTVLADYAAIAIENSRYVARIRKLTLTDEYTGLYNTRYMHEFLDRFFADSGIRERGIAAVFIDMDNFKNVVDVHGHLQGSKVLRQIGQTILSGLSATDRLIKYGGDEYIILMPGRDKAAARAVSAEISRKISQTPYRVNGDVDIYVTASFGIAAVPEDAAEKKDLLIEADTALFEVKKSGHKGRLHETS